MRKVRKISEKNIFVFSYFSHCKLLKINALSKMRKMRKVFLTSLKYTIAPIDTDKNKNRIAFDNLFYPYQSE